MQPDTQKVREDDRCEACRDRNCARCIDPCFCRCLGEDRVPADLTPTPATPRPPLDLDAIRAPMKIWFCKVGEVSDDLLPPGSDFLMREAVERTYEEIAGQVALFTFSGWGGSLTEGERACVEERLPDFDLVASEDPETLRAEVAALRAELDATKTAYDQAERIVGAMHYAVCGDRISPEGVLPDVVNTVKQLRAELDAARAERTEPATGEDVEVVARLLYAEDAGDNWEEMAEHLEDADPETQQAYRNAAGRILAALDLPGREQALRKENERLTAANANGAATLTSTGELISEWREKWLDLEQDRDGWKAEAKEAYGQRDDALHRLANVTSAHDDLKNAYDQLHVARDNTARLLEEARRERDEAHNIIRGLARQHAGGEGGGSDE